MKEQVFGIAFMLMGLLAVIAVALPLAWEGRRRRRLSRGLIGEVTEGVVEDVEAQTNPRMIPRTIPDYYWVRFRYEVPGKGTYKVCQPFYGPGHGLVEAIGRRVKVRYLPSSPNTSVLLLDEISEPVSSDD